MKTAVQEIIQWSKENAFNVKSQDGNSYIAIDYEEMRTKFEEFLEKERFQITEAVKYGYNDALRVLIKQDISFDCYYDRTFTDDVS